MTINYVRTLTLPAITLVAFLLCMAPTLAQTPSQQKTLPSEMPAKLKPTNDGFDYTRRDVMIPMRDRVKLHTVILVPKGAKRAPILLRTSSTIG